MLYLGIDGGGTKTEAILCDENGHILRRVLAGASAPSSIPEEDLRQTMKGLLDALSLDPQTPVTAFAGISGCIKAWDRGMFRKAVLPILPANISLTLDGDGTCGLNAAFGPHGDGLLLIVGTGSTALMRRNGQFSEIGGWGYLLGDEGSGYDMGRRAINTALKALDGRGRPTILTRTLPEKVGVPMDEITNQMYFNGRRGIASCAGALIEAAMAGDEPAMEQFTAAVAELRLHIRTARRKAPGLRLAVAGGLPAHYPLLWERITEGFEDMEPLLLTMPPVYGAVLAALGCVPEGLEKRFMDEYTQCLQEETRRVSDAANDKMESGEALPERSDRECDDKEETRRVSDAANDKMESGEALPERSDRECDDKEEKAK